jgi:hypothetical protein
MKRLCLLSSEVLSIDRASPGHADGALAGLPLGRHVVGTRGGRLSHPITHQITHTITHSRVQTARQALWSKCTILFSSPSVDKQRVYEEGRPITNASPSKSRCL